MAELQGPVLITGGLGYVGGRVASYLRQRHETLPINLMTRWRRTSATWTSAFNVIEGDILDKAALARAIEGANTIVHLAASNAAESARDPVTALDVTSKGTLMLLEAAEKAGTERFVYLSTFHVYGGHGASNINEDTLPQPTHPYAITHYTAEQFVSMFRAHGIIETLILRLSNCYGSPMDSGADCWSLVFGDLCRQAAEQGRLVLSSSGRPQRDFISINDVGRAVEHLLSLPSGSWGDGLFNLGGECSMSILELSGHIARVYEAKHGRPLPISTGDGADPHTWNPVHFDVSKLKAIGFSPEHNLDEEVRRTLDLCNSR